MDHGASSYHRFLLGEISGFEDIVALYGDQLMLFIKRYVQDTSVAEDLMEDTFLELLIHKRKFREDAKFKTYLFQIGRNKALNYMKKASYRLNVPLEDYEYLPSKEVQIDSILIQKEQYHKLHQALHQLKPEYREILCLLYFDELTYEEAGKVMNKSKKQIDNLAYKAKQSLKSILVKEDFI